jgi:hypothetical protein
MATVLNPVAVSRLDQIAVVDLEGNYLDAVIVVDDAVLLKLFDLYSQIAGR